MEVARPTPAPAACLNCGCSFGDPRPRYCPSCGQETNVKPPTLIEFAQQFGGSYIAAEGALWRTLKLLLFRPGQLTREYLAGRRRRYVLPLRLYLTVSLIVLLALRFTTAINIDVDPSSIATAGGAQKKSFVVIDFGADRRAGLADGKFYCVGLPRWACDRLERRLDLDPKNLARELREAPARFLSHWGTAMFLLVPAFAAWQRLVYRNRGLRYTEHLVYALHLHTFWFIALPLMLADFAPLQVAAGLATPVYSLMAARRVYGGRWWPTLLRAATVMTLYGLTMSVALMIVTVWTLLS